MLYGEEHLALMASIRRLMDQHIEPHVQEWEDAEAFGHIRAGGMSMAIAMQTDMATPALARFGSDELRRDYLAPAIADEVVAAIDLITEVADWCVQFQGGMGYTRENRASRALWDYRLGSIGGGADEVMLGIIAKSMGLGNGR